MKFTKAKRHNVKCVQTIWSSENNFNKESEQRVSRKSLAKNATKVIEPSESWKYTRALRKVVNKLSQSCGDFQFPGMCWGQKVMKFVEILCPDGEDYGFQRRDWFLDEFAGFLSEVSAVGV